MGLNFILKAFKVMASLGLSTEAPILLFLRVPYYTYMRQEPTTQFLIIKAPTLFLFTI